MGARRCVARRRTSRVAGRRRNGRVLGVLAWLHADVTSWGVISALFVLQQSSDGTLEAAAERFVGTLTGSLVGLAAVALPPGDPLVLPRLALAVLRSAEASRVPVTSPRRWSAPARL